MHTEKNETPHTAPQNSKQTRKLLLTILLLLLLIALFLYTDEIVEKIFQWFGINNG